MRTHAIRFVLALLLVPLLFGLVGCTNADLQGARGAAQTTQLVLAAAEGQVAEMRASLAEARQLAAESGDARIAATVGKIEAGLAAAERNLPALREASATAAKTLETLAAAGDGEVPWWKVAIGLAVPLLLPLARNVPAIGPVLGVLGDLIERKLASDAKRAEWERIEARAKLPPVHPAEVPGSPLIIR